VFVLHVTHVASDYYRSVGSVVVWMLSGQLFYLYIKKYVA